MISMLVLGWDSLVWERRGLRADCTLCYGCYSGRVNCMSLRGITTMMVLC